MPIKEWLQRINEPIFDEEVAKQIVKFLYTHAEEIQNTDPEIWVCDSEYQAQILANIMYQNDKTKDSKQIVKKIELDGGEREYFRKEFIKKLKKVLKDWLKTDYKAKSCHRAGEILAEYIVGPKTDAIPKKISDQIITNSLEIFDKIDKIIEGHVLPYYFSTPVYGTDADFMWLNKYEETRDKEGHNKTIDEYMELAKKCTIGALIEFDNVVFVCKKTTEHHFTPDGLMLHNPKGPSCINLEKKHCYHVFNVYFDESLWKKFFPLPEDENEKPWFSFEELMKVDNAEQRMAIIKAWGFARILGDDVEKRACDKRMEYSIYLKKELPNYLIPDIKIGNRTFQYLILTDPSVEKVYAFLVPTVDDNGKPIKTVYDAKKWHLNGVDPDSFLIES